MTPPVFVPPCLPPCGAPPARAKLTDSQALSCNLRTSLVLAPSPAAQPASTPVPQPAGPVTELGPLAPRPAPGATIGHTVLLWFRSDLRLHDHPALAHALEEAGSSGSILPVYVFDTAAFGRTPFGFEKTGRHRARFLQQAVSRLRSSLRALGSDLVIRVGDPNVEICNLADTTRASTVITHSPLAPESAAGDETLASRLQSRGVSFTHLWTGTLYDVHDLPFPITNLPFVYTQFREAVQKQSVIRKPIPAPCEVAPLPTPTPPSGELPTLEQLGLQSSKLSSTTMTTTSDTVPFMGGEDEALQRLSCFVKESRSARPAAAVLGGDFACRISPWLALGCVSPRRIYADLAGGASTVAQTTTYFELVWRDFFRYVTVKFAKGTKQSSRGITKPHMARRTHTHTLPAPAL